jgi:hypothetical protein
MSARRSMLVSSSRHVVSADIVGGRDGFASRENGRSTTLKSSTIYLLYSQETLY